MRATATPPAHGSGVTGSRLGADRLALLAAVVLFAALALFGARFHWVEEAGSAERDGFVRQAEELLAGTLPRDPYRPLLYPLLVAGLSLPLGDPFTAARLLSNLAAAVLAWLAYRFGTSLGGDPRMGGWAMALTAVNPNLWLLGQSCTTDMVFAAFAATALVAAFEYLDRPRPAAALAVGLAYGLAAFTRSSALLLLPALLVCWWLAPATPSRGRRRWGLLALATAVALLTLLPHWWLRTLVFGEPFYSRNWVNLAWKIEGFPDWSYLDRVPYGSAGELVSARWREIVVGGLEEMVRFAAGGWRQLLGTWLHVILFCAGAALALRRWRRRAAWLLWALASAAEALCFLFFAWGRFLLFLLPPAAALTCALGGQSIPGLRGLGLRRWGLRVSPGTLLLALAVAVLTVKTVGYRMPAFIGRHPYDEVAALEGLAATQPAGVVFAGTSPFLGRYIEQSWVYIPDAFGAEVEDASLYFATLRSVLERSGADFLITGPVDLRQRPRELLGETAPVPWLEPWERGEGVVVWRIRRELL